MSWPPKGIWVVEVVGGGGVVGLMRFRGGSISSVTKNKKIACNLVLLDFAATAIYLLYLAVSLQPKKNPPKHKTVYIILE